MSGIPDPWFTDRPRWITPFDFRRSYLLYDDVETNISRRGSLTSYDYGAHNWARGHLVELHRRLGGTPLSLHYRELLARHPLDAVTAPEHLPVGSEVTARLRDRAGQLLTVVSRSESAPHGPRGDYWQVTVDGVVPRSTEDPLFDGVHAYPPSLPFLAFLVHLHLDRQPRPTPA